MRSDQFIGLLGALQGKQNGLAVKEHKRKFSKVPKSLSSNYFDR